MSYQEDVFKILDRVDNDINLAVEETLSAGRKIIAYVLWIGLDSIKAKRRALRRRELKREFDPEYVMGKNGRNFSLATKKKLLKITKVLFGEDGWQIGDINVGDFTKENLLA